jgi:hypothetical protein
MLPAYTTCFGTDPCCFYLLTTHPTFRSACLQTFQHKHSTLNPAGEGAGLGQEVMEMLKKMKAQEYHLPDSLNLTPECKALLRALLHPESEKRVKMAGIMADPWFRTDLPPDALNMNDKYLANTRPCPQSEGEIKNIVAMATNYNTNDMYASQGMDQF